MLICTLQLIKNLNIVHFATVHEARREADRRQQNQRVHWQLEDRPGEDVCLPSSGALWYFRWAAAAGSIHRQQTLV